MAKDFFSVYSILCWSNVKFALKKIAKKKFSSKMSFKVLSRHKEAFVSSSQGSKVAKIHKDCINQSLNDLF